MPSYLIYSELQFHHSRKLMSIYTVVLLYFNKKYQSYASSKQQRLLAQRNIQTERKRQFNTDLVI